MNAMPIQNDDILVLIPKFKRLFSTITNRGFSEVAYLWEQAGNIVNLKKELLKIITSFLEICPNLNCLEMQEQNKFRELYLNIAEKDASLMQDSEEKQKKVMELPDIGTWFNEFSFSVSELIFIMEKYVRAYKKPWQMTYGQFYYFYFPLVNYTGILYGIAHLDENETKRISKEGRKIFVSLLPENIQSKADNDFYVKGYDDWERLFKIAHKHQIEQAISAGTELSDHILIEDYPSLFIEKKHKAIAKELSQLINERIIKLILENFDKIDLDTNRNFNNIKAKFDIIFKAGGLTDLELEIEKKKIILFKNKIFTTAGNKEIIYVMAYANSIIVEEPWCSCFEFDRGINYPVHKVQSPAVVFYNGDDKEIHYERDNQRWVTIRKGKIKN